jgi:hypothetical protein
MTSLVPLRQAVAEFDAVAQLRAIAEALRETQRMQLEQSKLVQRQLDRLDGAAPRAHVASHRGPLNARHQTWRGFVKDLQQLEAQARREGLKLTKANVCRFGIDTPKTITRTMRWYGLATSDWPPSIWDPNADREGGADGEN